MARRKRKASRQKASGRQIMNEMAAPKTAPELADIVEASHRREAVELWYDAVDVWEKVYSEGGW